MAESQSLEHAPDIITNHSTRERWDWVHKAISSAKSSNAQALKSAEADRPVAVRQYPASA